MPQKQCFKCLQTKDLSEFYTHPEMADGYLGKCKECTKLDSRKGNRSLRAKEHDRERNQKPERKAARKVYVQKWRENNPDGYKAHNALNNALRDGKIKKPKHCSECGAKGKLHAHHEDYSKPLAVDWLCVQCHAKHNPIYLGPE